MKENERRDIMEQFAKDVSQFVETTAEKSRSVNR